jgi:hypothetical protein
MSTDDSEPNSLTFTEFWIDSLTFDLDTLAALLAQQPMERLIALVDKIDYETADWHFFNALDTWMKNKLSQEIEDPYG